MVCGRLWWGFSVLAVALPLGAAAALQGQEGKVSFSCDGPGGLRIEGTGNELQVSDQPDALVVVVPMAKLSTGIGLRDHHMHGKYLESEKYPTAELVVPRAELKFPADGASVDATAAGTLTIHGKSKPVTVHYKATRRGNAFQVQGAVKIDMRDYGIEQPSYLGVTVKPPVDIAVSFKLVET